MLVISQHLNIHIHSTISERPYRHSPMISLTISLSNHTQTYHTNHNHNNNSLARLTINLRHQNYNVKSQPSIIVHNPLLIHPKLHLQMYRMPKAQAFTTAKIMQHSKPSNELKAIPLSPHTNLNCLCHTPNSLQQHGKIHLTHNKISLRTGNRRVRSKTRANHHHNNYSSISTSSKLRHISHHSRRRHSNRSSSSFGNSINKLHNNNSRRRGSRPRMRRAGTGRRVSRLRRRISSRYSRRW